MEDFIADGIPFPRRGESSYPLSVKFRFLPGGGVCQAVGADDVGSAQRHSLVSLTTPPPQLLQDAATADDRLRMYTLLSGAPENSTYYLPSLSILSEAAFGRLTGIAPNNVKEWADSLVMAYLEEEESQRVQRPANEDQIWNHSARITIKPPSTTPSSTACSLASKLKEIQEKAELRQEQEMSDSPSAFRRRRPCGYVFQRGDIAWNCRTCQTDPTCVVCDDCFRRSDHQGHEVYFHRTTPGGCCDCGDIEAWKIEGCCDLHRPDTTQVVPPSADDPMEAVKMAKQGLKEEEAFATMPPTSLSPKTTAALATVIGAAVQCIVQAADGAGIGADPSQFKHKWPVEASLVANGKISPYAADDGDENRPRRGRKNPSHFATETFPTGYRLSLRLHNDDVHTFDEVIDALHESSSRHRRGNSGSAMASESLVSRREQATSLTQLVDSDGQVTVTSYDNLASALVGFRRLKSFGLHCAVVSSPQVQQELRARSLIAWLAEIASAHPVASSLVVQALVQVQGSVNEKPFAGLTPVWKESRSIPLWASGDSDERTACQRRFTTFPPHWESSYLTQQESGNLYKLARALVPPSRLAEVTGTTLRPGDGVRRSRGVLPPERYHKCPHALWGTLPARYVAETSVVDKHPFLVRLVGDTRPVGPHSSHDLTEVVYVVDTDLRKQQEADRITSSLYPHKLPGLHLLSGVATVPLEDLDEQGMPKQEADEEMDQPLPQPDSYLPNAMEYRHLLATSSFRAPLSPILLLLLLDPYPTKQLRGALHALFLSLLTDARFRCRFAGALAIAYRPLSTLFCAGVGTEADTPLHFAVQILTAGSLVRALGSAPAIASLLLPDQEFEEDQAPSEASATIGVFCSPIAHTIVRCIHTNLLGATKEVNMILNNTYSGNDDEEGNIMTGGNDSLLPALTYVAGEHPLMTLLPAAPDDGFLDSRSTRHKRLPHLLRDLEYVMETPGTALRLLLPQRFPVYQGPQLSFRGEDVLSFPVVFSRMLRLAQGMDPQKRKISGGHVEYEQNRWLEAFGLSLNLAGARDALAESPSPSDSLSLYREAMGNLISAILREIKVWLYREGMLETGLPVPSGGTHGLDLARIETLQRSTLHVSGITESEDGARDDAVALSCATGVKMPEHQLSLIESALKAEGAERLLRLTESGRGNTYVFSGGTVMGDWLRVPHSPLAGDSLSFHLPLHRALAKTVRSSCSVVVSEEDRMSNPTWWKIPILDEERNPNNTEPAALTTHPLVPLIWPTLRSSNCRVVWTAGPDCSPQEAHRRRSRSRNVSANIAVAKVVHSLADHPIRCIAAAQQIERHLWAKNGSSVAGMAINYTSTGLCRSFRDLDLLMVQLSASGMSAGLGARRVLSLLQSRFSMDGYLCDPERRVPTSASGASNPFSTSNMIWVNPPRLQDPDHAVVLAESFFSTLCVVVTELPPSPPTSKSDTAPLQQTIRRELLHALASEPRSRSEAMNAAAIAASRRDDGAAGMGDNGGGSLFRDVFSGVLTDIAKQKTVSSSRASSGPPAFELKPEFCDEYDPTFYHLRRQDHQHAMDVVARLRKQKWGNDKDAADARCLPIVCAPPKAHPRFLPCRLLLHLPPLDAAVRRMLLFALTGGLWLPPAEPRPTSVEVSEGRLSRGSVGESEGPNITPHGDVPNVTTFTRRLMHRASSGSSTFKRQSSDSEISAPFSKEVVAASAVSFLEVLQLLTLQVHTLEECAALHRTLPDLDEESRQISAGLSINSYLSRLVTVPESLVDVWALKPHPEGPLESKGSGQNRGSILGLLIALYEHRADHGAVEDSDEGQAEQDHGGARSLASSGLKWLLRFVNALVDGSPSVAAAVKSATSGVPFQQRASKSPSMSDASSATWTINAEVQSTAKHMLGGLRELWPVKRAKTPVAESAAMKSKEAGKAAQKKMLEKMKMMQNKFATSMAPSEDTTEKSDEEECIICRCDDADGENNGPLGYLGHVQRSRVLQMRSVQEQSRETSGKSLVDSYRVVGHKGCQLRETEAMDSKPLECLPRGSIVTVLERKFTSEYDILSRRVRVRHESKQGDTVHTTEGWASVQSSQGYVILKPLVLLCYSNTRWGMTRPIIKQCGHAAHLKCVETHTLSLHQRAAGEQPYDGRFAANISDGEFLCPLCKQLSNILIPRDTFVSREDRGMEQTEGQAKASGADALRKLLCSPRLLKRKAEPSNDMCWVALESFGSNMYQAMSVTWDRSSRKKQQLQWHPSIRKWDYDEDVSTSDSSMKGILRAMREQLIAWSAIGHSAAAAEAGSRGVEEVLPFGTMSQTSDPWSNYNKKSQFDHAMLLELKRTLGGASGLLEVLSSKLANQLAKRDGSSSDEPVVGACLADALQGISWALRLSRPGGVADDLLLWSELTSITASTPCHVARDGVVTQKCEARGAACAMWASMGLGASSSKSGEPPAPFALKRLLHAASISDATFKEGWGTTDPFIPSQQETGVHTPFRPAVASAFLYTPLMAWDLLTLSAGVLSDILVNECSRLPTCEDLMYIAQLLVTARVVQSIVTPHGVEMPDAMDLDDDEDCWGADEKSTQAQAMARLFSHCRTMVRERKLDSESGLVGSIEGLVPNSVLAGVGAAILPFTRALILLLRATRACINDRLQKTGASEQRRKSYQSLDNVICDSELMEVEDGFFFVKAIGGPFPASLIEGSGEWLPLINRWLVSVVGFDIHNGPDGPGVASTLLPHLVQKSLTLESSGPSKRAASQNPSPAGNGSGSGVDESMASDGHVAQDPFSDRPAVIELINNAAAAAVGEILDADMDENEEMIDFGEQLMGASMPLYELVDDQVESSDDSVYDETVESDREFAHVSRSPVLVYQPSLLGLQSIGPGRHGTTLEYTAASSVMADLSHFGVMHRKQIPTFSLICLPKSFVELYNIVNKVKGREEMIGEDNEDTSGAETAICLLTGSVLRSGSARRSSYNRSLRPPGACTLHARKTGSGIGIFFLVQKCTVLLMHNNKSAYSPSLYVDEHGEEDPGLRRGRPLTLNKARYQALELLWRQQRVPWEVAQIRSTSDRVIRDNWVSAHLETSNRYQNNFSHSFLPSTNSIETLKTALKYIQITSSI